MTRMVRYAVCDRGLCSGMCLGDVTPFLASSVSVIGYIIIVCHVLGLFAPPLVICISSGGFLQIPIQQSLLQIGPSNRTFLLPFLAGRDVTAEGIIWAHSSPVLVGMVGME